MKTLYAILFMVSVAYSQSGYTSPMAVRHAVAPTMDTLITERTWLFGQIDTTSAIDLGGFGNALPAIQTTDTVSVIIKYQLSQNGTDWTAITTLDSSRQTSATSAVWSSNITTTVLGKRYIRFTFSFTKSNVYGSTTYASTSRKYWATIKRY